MVKLKSNPMTVPVTVMARSTLDVHSPA